jgi:hypothetical protein
MALIENFPAFHGTLQFITAEINVLLNGSSRLKKRETIAYSVPRLKITLYVIQKLKHFIDHKLCNTAISNT